MAKKVQKEQSKGTDELHISATIEHEFPVDHVPIPSNHMALQCNEKEVHIHFFHIRPPVISGDDPKAAEKAKAIKAVTARCVAEVIMSPQRFLEFAEIVVKQRDRLMSRFASVAKEIQEKSAVDEEESAGNGKAH